MADDAGDVVDAVLKAAKSGDMQAAKLVLDRLYPARRDNPVTFALPEIRTAGDAAKAMAVIIAAVGAGELTPSEATDVTALIERFRRNLELAEIEERLRVLEER
jgi:hypothetical protein